ncbi:HupE/UreJ family protein [Paracoccus sp. FO-3]|uniref:HupE/UreJ family protein n=1 Tax=Paracoccus sp. FO-3 TaxID=1335059 RepID=UPI00112D6EC0|nr:HupE/UreJ family protein [Paracoccus sp. FO-3]
MTSFPRARWRPFTPWQALVALATTLAAFLLAGAAFAHNVTEGDAGYVQEVTGFRPIAFIYLGAKHMVTGYDHLLFLAGVIFFLYRSKDIATYVSIFAIGHSVTMIAGVWWSISINAYVIDAIIAFSVVYKALDNLGAFRLWFGVQPNTKAATLIFGLLHGFGLATKIQSYEISPDGLLGNLIAFNVGVELGQLMALALILTAMTQWRGRPAFARQAYAANVLMMVAGFALMGLQITGYFVA